jgi:lysophospholipase L1-like esterase
MPFCHILGFVLLTVLVTIVGSEAVRAETLICARFAQEDLPAPAPRADRHALDRLARINDAVKTTPHSVLFLGDSLTEGWDPGVWKQTLAPRGVLNAGVSGDRTDHLLWRLQNGNLAGPPARAAILLIGTNDLSYGRTAELTADGIRANLELLRRQLPEAKILLLGLLPREETAAAPLRIAVAQVNRLIRDCDDGEHVIYADMGDVLLDETGRLPAAISPDQLHFRAHGYSLLASRLVPVLDRLIAR